MKAGLEGVAARPQLCCAAVVGVVAGPGALLLKSVTEMSVPEILFQVVNIKSAHQLHSDGK